jgi:alpha-1,3-glucosyltransferase
MSNFEWDYRGLDYPPLTAYHMMFCGKLAEVFNPEWVALNVSRGFESFDHNIFMRSTVILGDLILLVPAALMVKREFGLFAMLGLLFNPCLILVDHGHFQYNSIR